MEIDTVVVETHPNPHIVTYHVRRRLIESSILPFESKDWEALGRADSGLLLRVLRRLLGKSFANYERREYRERRKNAPMINDLFGIEGVERVTLGPYEISISKGNAFSWEELDNQIIDVLSKYGFNE